MELAAMVARRLPLLLLPVLLLLLLLAAFPTGTAQNMPPPPVFRCTSATAAKCHALAGYVTDNETTYEAIKSLFQVHSLHALYGANDLDASTSAATRVPAGTTVKVPFPCACANGTGVSDGRPVYTVKSGDTLYDIATKIYKSFVTYPQIAAANGVKNVSLIEPGQSLRIPLPCSCDPADGHEAVHLAHAVAQGSSLASIAEKFGTTEATLAQINNISDPKTLQAGQILDVPLRACNSSIRSDALDRGLRVPNGGYALTADNCVKCSCSDDSWQLECKIEDDLPRVNSSTCPPATCSGRRQMKLGGDTSDGCASTRCDYAGYNGSAILTIAVTDRSACATPPNSGGGDEGTPPNSGAHALLRPLPWGTSSCAPPPLLAALLLFALL